ncbi:hypothetical protein [Bradyrhizobium mercantei]|uniref:hypothetical protein n=1 Tax=Bradyrhizobium mercantei TaxID=1904807 RepID=UPI001178B38D|nr:hypothetical protein [Bradyrhizobium mercantei]
MLALMGAGSVGVCRAETRPLADGEKKIISDSYGADLKDPVSAQYRWSDLVIDPAAKGNEVGYCFRVNAKNSYGGYTGFRTIAGTVKRNHGKVVSYSYKAGTSEDAILGDLAERICRVWGYNIH